ncbi:MAG: hypothetical protein AAF645_12095 [Myxococcota bacterium]
MTRRFPMLAAVLALAGFATRASAQSQNPPANACEANAASDACAALHARAGAAHERGAEALREARFAEARDAFREAMSIFENGPSAYNLALALRGTGESLEAIALFERLLDGAFGPVGEERASDMRRWIQEERGALSRVAVHVEGADAATIRVDGDRVGEAREGDPLELSLNAGRRVLIAEAAGFESAETVIFAERASNASVDLRLLPSDDSRPVTAKPAFWIVLGAVVVVGVAAGLVAAFAPYERDPLASSGPLRTVSAQVPVP